MKVRFVTLIALLLAVAAGAADVRPLPAPPIIGATSYLVIDARTGHQIAALEPDKALAPASLILIRRTTSKTRPLKRSRQVRPSTQRWMVRRR